MWLHATTITFGQHHHRVGCYWQEIVCIVNATFFSSKSFQKDPMWVHATTITFGKHHHRAAHYWQAIVLAMQLLLCMTFDEYKNNVFLAALAALYLTLVSGSLTDCHFRILTQRVTFETSDPSDI